jgi:hypothetical protein
MSKHSLENLEKHWSSNTVQFRQENTIARDVFAQILTMLSDAAAILESRRTLESNCSYLLLAKAINHISSTVLLMERGLMVDSALAARNGIETLLLLDLLSKKPELCQKWVNGEKFKPVDVRKQLQGLLHVPVGDLVIETSQETYDEISFLYAWLSRITHANLESLNHATTQTGGNSYEIHVGGAHSQPVIVAITQSIGAICIQTVATSLAVHQPKALEASAAQLKKIQSTLRALGPNTGAKEESRATN